VSTNRCECHFGLTPGGCSDHPGVWPRMERFFRAVVTRYRDLPHLHGWDAWNELRWDVHAQGLVCYCPHTLAAFRAWLRGKYGELAALNEAWIRRYDAWEDVMPGRAPHRPFTEMMAFAHFLTERSNAHGRRRYELIKALDSQHPVTVHGQAPSVYEMSGYGNATWGSGTPVNRGNDWVFADELDGVGCSSFPKWDGWNWKDYAARMEIIRSAAGKKLLWLSELQGGRAQWGSKLELEVPATDQQHWIYNGMAVGADAILFWCWRDEVFTGEAGGFGIVGQDGRAEERVAALRQTGTLIREHAALIDAYRPAAPAVGVFFSPQTCYLNWCQDCNGNAASTAFLGYARALIERNIPFEAVEEAHLEALARLKVLFLPRTLVLQPETEERLLDFVRAGGTLLVESECGAFDARGLYRYAPERFVARATGACEVGKRSNDTADRLIGVALNGRTYTLKTAQLLTPWRVSGTAWAQHPHGALLAEQKHGQGRIVLVGTHLGEGYQAGESPDFSALLETIVHDSGAPTDIAVLGPQPLIGQTLARHGMSGGRRVMFVLGEADAPAVRLGLTPAVAGSGRFRDLIAGQPVNFEREGDRFVGAVPLTRWRMAVLVEADAISSGSDPALDPAQ
jgi:beta-galactosidase